MGYNVEFSREVMIDWSIIIQLKNRIRLLMNNDLNLFICKGK